MIASCTIPDFNCLMALFRNFQKADITNNYYLKEFQGRMTTLDDYNANIMDLVPCLLEERLKEQYNKELANATEDEVNKAKEHVLKRGSATLLFIGADRGCYGSLKD